MGSKKVFFEVLRRRPHIVILYFSNIVAFIVYISIREPKHQGRRRQIKLHFKINIGS